MRKQNREICDLSDIISVMKKCDVCRIALNGEEFPYLIPLNFGLMENNGHLTLYFHSALEGEKISLMRKDNRVSFEMDCSHQLQYFKEKGYCTFAYESVIGNGYIEFVEGEEKRAGLEAIMRQYHDAEAYFNPDAIPRTLVYKLRVKTITGKRKVVKK